MKINDLIEVKYISRPNRFTIKFKNSDNKLDIAHLHDPGRLKELLIENTPILIKYVPTYKKTNRKTKYNVIAIKDKEDWILLNSNYHNKIVEELIDNHEIPGLEKYHVEKPEYSYGNSRLDFLLTDEYKNKMYLEVKGCTLQINKLAKFPDAPTKRGTKHLNELINIRKNHGNSAVVILILHNKAETFMPNYDTDPEFSNTLKKAYENNVEIYPFHMITKTENDSLIIEADKKLPLILK